MTSRPTAVVEDSDADFLALRRAYADVAPDTRLVRYRDADEAITRLAAIDQDGEWPTLVLLDLNLPGRSGLDALAHLRGSPALRSLPVVVLSGSGRQEDVDASYERGASAYIVKPMVFAQLRHALRALRDFYALAAVPGRTAPGPAPEAAR